MSTTFSSTGGWSDKVRCDICGRTGYGPELAAGQLVVKERFSPWQKACLGGHPYECDCGSRFSTRTGLVNHIRMTKRGGRHGEA